MWNYVVDPLIIYWNQREWKAFPKDIQNAILEAAQEAGRFETALSRAGLDGDKSLKILKDEFNYTMEVPDPIAFMESKGMEIHRPRALSTTSGFRRSGPRSTRRPRPT